MTRRQVGVLAPEIGGGKGHLAEVGMTDVDLVHVIEGDEGHGIGGATVKKGTN